MPSQRLVIFASMALMTFALVASEDLNAEQKEALQNLKDKSMKHKIKPEEVVNLLKLIGENYVDPELGRIGDLLSLSTIDDEHCDRKSLEFVWMKTLWDWMNGPLEPYILSSGRALSAYCRETANRRYLELVSQIDDSTLDTMRELQAELPAYKVEEELLHVDLNNLVNVLKKLARDSTPKGQRDLTIDYRRVIGERFLKGCDRFYHQLADFFSGIKFISTFDYVPSAEITELRSAFEACKMLTHDKLIETTSNMMEKFKLQQLADLRSELGLTSEDLQASDLVVDKDKIDKVLSTWDGKDSWWLNFMFWVRKPEFDSRGLLRNACKQVRSFYLEARLWLMEAGLQDYGSPESLDRIRSIRLCKFLLD